MKIFAAIHLSLRCARSYAVVQQSQRMLATKKGQPVMIIQPDLKWGPKKDFMSSADERLVEAKGLVEAAGDFYVADSMVVGMKMIVYENLFTTGVFEIVKERVRKTRDECHKRNESLTVLFNYESLNAAQQTTCEFAWKTAVFDRFQLILLIFARYASSREAQLSCELAETRLIRARLKYIRSPEYQRLLIDSGGRPVASGLYQLVERSGNVGLLTQEASFEEHSKLLEEREAKLQGEFERVRRERLLRTAQSARLSASRRATSGQNARPPKVCVVGYTNAGKTALVAALSRGLDVAAPSSRMFATLDVTRHAGSLPGSHQRVVFVDTVGFVSEMPVELRDAFRATLDDALDADLVLHVADASHSCIVKQRHTVRRTLQELAEEIAGVRGSHTDAGQFKMTVLDVCNKSDLLDEAAREAVMSKLGSTESLENRFVKKRSLPKAQAFVDCNPHEPLFVSAATGDGLHALRERIESLLTAKLGLLRKAFRVAPHRQNEYISWFHRNAAVSQVEPDPNREGYVIVHCLMTELSYELYLRECKSNLTKASVEATDND